jgi:hypothetical protein
MADVVINVGAVSAITAGTGLTGGTITGTGTIAASFGTSAGTICEGNDARLTAPVAPLAHASTHTAGGSDPLTLSQAQITSLGTDLAAKVAATRQVIAGTGMGGGGALSADVTLNVSYGTSGTTACVGNDARLSNARTPSTHASTHGAAGSDAITIAQSQVTSLVSDLAAKALGSTTMTAGTGLTGGGDLSANRSFAVAYGTTSTTATVGNDARLSFLAAGTGATSRTLQNKLRDVISVKDFGAVGDGVADDTVAIQAALTAGTGKSVYLPAGTYKTTAVLNVYESTCFFAEKGTGIISVTPTASAATVNSGILISGNNVVIDGIYLVGTNEASFDPGTGYRNFYARAIFADSFFSGAVYTRPTIKNCLIFKWGCGIELRRASTYTITGNRFWGGAQVGDALLEASTGDISIYGSTSPNDSFRGIITENFCLGNQDNGIGAGANEGDHDITISNNVIWPLQEDGVTPLADIDNKSRYAILVGYVGNSSCRTVISNNVIRDYGHTGIDCQTNSPPGGDIVVANNIVSRCGFSIKYPVDVSLKGGIWVDGGADSITGNLVLDCTKVGIQYNSAQPIDGTDQHPRAVIANNNVARIAVDTNIAGGFGHGIVVTGAYTSGVLVSSNRIQAIAGIGILVGVGAGAAYGNVHVIANQISTTSTAGGIQVSNSGGLDCSVVGNSIVGADNTTSNSTYNAGIWFANGVVHCSSNVITKFYYGIQYSVSPSRNITNICSNNSISTCQYGINCGTGNWIVSTNAISGSVTSNLTGGAWQGIVYNASNLQGFGGGPIIEVADTGFPTSGTWAIGDRCKKTNAASGSPKGWICTVAGSAGTWTSEGNL